MFANPWLVENIQEFSFLNCPECAFKVKDEDTFQDHAVRNHSQSSALFGHNAKSEFITVKTEPSSEISSYHFKCELSSNVNEIEIEEQTIDPLGGISPKKEMALEELMFSEPDEKNPDEDTESVIMKTYSYQEKMDYASLIAEALNNFPSGAALHPDSIYKAINARYPQYKMDNPIWKAGIRNNLSLHKNFIQEGKYWKLAPDCSISITKVQNSNNQDLDVTVKHNEIGENSLVDKVITNVRTENVRITPKILKIIPMEKFPPKDKTTSIFKCQIPPKKIPKPIIADDHHIHIKKKCLNDN
jgi:hypothetical protein